MSKDRIIELKKALDEEPSSKAFLELARLLIKKDSESSDEKDNKKGNKAAKEVLFQGLYYYPKNLVARLLLAKLFYQDGFYNFSAREIAEVWSETKSETTRKLLLSFGDYGEHYLSIYSGQSIKSEAESVLAEIDLEADISDAIIEFDEE